MDDHTLLSAVNQSDQKDVIEERHGKKSELDAAIAGEHRNRADGEISDDADGVLDAEGVEICGAFEAGVYDVGEKSGGKEAEEPFAPGEKIVLVTRVVFEVGREE